MDTEVENDTALYELNGVERMYRRGGVTVHALRGIDLTIGRGELLSIEGPSGSGKSTLLQLLGALDVPTSGSIMLAREELGRCSERRLTDIRAREIGFVFQQFNLIPTLTATENVMVAMTGRRGKAINRTRASELLVRVGLGHRLRHLPSRLSGGEQQRVAIARALANSPGVIIADEPTGNLDSDSAGDVMGLLDQLRGEDGVTVIVATHDEEVARRADRRVRLRNGKVTSMSRE
jgi:putative ABC transport system ATP-binding protein